MSGQNLPRPFSTAATGLTNQVESVDSPTLERKTTCFFYARLGGSPEQKKSSTTKESNLSGRKETWIPVSDSVERILVRLKEVVVCKPDKHANEGETFD